MKKIYFLPVAFLFLTACQTMPLKPESTTLSSEVSTATSTKVESSEPRPSSTVTVSENEEILSKKITVSEITLTPIDVYEIALESYPELHIYSLGLDNDRIYGFVYEVEGVNEATEQKIELDIHPVSGKIVHKEEETWHIKDQMKKELTRERITNIQSLVDQTLAQNPNATLDEWVAEYDDGRFELEVEIYSKNQKHEFTYDLAN
ncbi:MAG: hypothetical protein GX180_10200 [Enterococcus sp.]|nr:hypothetical protein [Enterococcus sp.]